MARRARIIAESAQEEGSNSDQNVTTTTEIETGEQDSASEAGVTGGFQVVDRSSEDSPFSQLEVVEAPRRGRPPGQARSTTRVPRATPNEIAQAAPLLVGLSNQVVVTWLGPECAMLQTEANFITPSVARILARLPRGAAQQVSLYTDPFIVLTALGLWAARIARIKDAQAKQKYQVEPFEAARAYGESGTEFQPETTGETPPISQSEESKNGQAKAASAAIFRTVSPT